MQGREYLAVAKHLVTRSTEQDWRAAAGRAYYALFLESRDVLRKWGYSPRGREELHSYVRLRYVYCSDSDFKRVGRRLEELVQLRNEADYQIDRPGSFATPKDTRQAIVNAEDAIRL
jgi:uncharacterized protein (UPF0332 family)